MKGKRTVALALSAMITLGSLTTLTSCGYMDLLDNLKEEISSDIKFLDPLRIYCDVDEVRNIGWQDDIIGITCVDVYTDYDKYYNVYYKVSSEDYDNFISGFAKNKTRIGDIPKGKLEELVNLTERYTMLGYDKVDALNQGFNFDQFLENDTTIEK